METYLKDVCEHCWHLVTGALHIVLRPGYVVMECCKCHEHKTVHQDHVYTELQKKNTQ